MKKTDEYVLFNLYFLVVGSRDSFKIHFYYFK